jgi:hypothetical protein
MAQDLTSAIDDERKTVWNLQCVGNLGIQISAFERPEATAALFDVNGQDFSILGAIEGGFFEEFQKELEKNPQVTRVVLGSGGGSVLDAIRAGLLIRAKGLETTLSASCYSACSLIFLGGVERQIWSPYPSLGFHQVSIEGKAVDVDSEVYQLIHRYSVDMNVDPNFVLLAMMKATPREMFEPELAALCEANVATWVQRLCFGGESQ